MIAPVDSPPGCPDIDRVSVYIPQQMLKLGKFVIRKGENQSVFFLIQTLLQWLL